MARPLMPTEKPLHWVGSSKKDLLAVLHCFQKKSPSGVRTAKQDVSLIHERLRTAQKDYEVRYEKQED